MQAIAAGQQPIVEIQFLLHALGIGQTSDAEQLLYAEPERLAIFKNQGQFGADADAPIVVQIATMCGEKFAALTGVVAKRQQVV